MSHPAPKKVMVIADVGGQSHYHVGDEAILTARLQWLRTRFPELCPVVVTKDEAFTSARHQVETIPYPNLPAFLVGGWQAGLMTRFPRQAPGLGCVLGGRAAAGACRLLRELQSCSLLYIAGGGNLTSSYSALLRYRSFIARHAVEMGIPVIVTGQQVGSYLTESDAALMKTWVPRTVCLGVRDALSLNMGRALGADEDQLILTGDDALDLIPVKVDCPIPDRIQSRPLVGLSLHSQGGAQTRESILSTLASVLGPWLKTIDADILFLPHVRSDVAHRCDITLARDLIRLMGLEGRAWVADCRDYYDAHIKYLTSQCQFVVTTRYHGAVFALSSAVPVVALSQDGYTREKFIGLFDYFGLPGPLGDLMSSSSYDLVRASWSARDAWASEVGIARIRAQENFRSVRERVAVKWNSAISTYSPPQA